MTTENKKTHIVSFQQIVKCAEMGCQSDYNVQEVTTHLSYKGEAPLAVHLAVYWVQCPASDI